MITKIFLWALVLFFAFHFAGHLFDLIANVPNWQSGEVSDVARYRDFYQKSDPKYFFIFVYIGSMIISLMSLILVWRKGGVTQILTAICLLIVICLFIWTMAFFVPINTYIWQTEYEPTLLKDLVKKWVTAEYFRLVIVGIGLLSSILALESRREN